MRKTKIIYINSRYYGREFHDESHDFFYLTGIGNVFAYELLRTNPSIKVENWRADKTIKKDLLRTIDDIVCRVFKGVNLNLLGVFSWSMIRELRKQIKCQDYYLLVHFHGLHNISYNIVSWLIPRITIIATHHGGGNFYFKHSKNGKLSTFLAEKFDKYTMIKRFGHVIVQTRTEYIYLSKFMTQERVSRLTPFGLNLDVFSNIDKTEARRSLGLPLDVKIILSIGRADGLKGVQHVVSIFQNLKKEFPKLVLICVDVLPGDLYYEEVKNSGAKIVGHTSWYNLPAYYSAADVLVYLPFDDESLNFAGPGYVNAEALACGIPVVSSLLIHYWDENFYGVASRPETIEEAESMTIEFLHDPPNNDKCREISYKFYNWEYVLKHHLKIYNELLKKHYNNTSIKNINHII